MRYRPDIDGLRAIAVLLVIFSHYGISTLAGGFIGVDIFFVISGYVITNSLVTEYARRALTKDEIVMISVRRFYSRRIKRIIPVTFFVIMINLCVSFFVFNKIKFSEIISESLNNFLFLGNFYQIRIGTDYLKSTLSETPLRHLWSLSIEEQFYLFYPLIFLAIITYHGLKFRHKSLNWLSRLSIFIGAITLLSFSFSVIQTIQNPIPAYFSTFGRIWELGFGCFVCLIEYKSNFYFKNYFKFFLSFLGLLCIGLSVVLYDSTSRFPGVSALLPVIGAALLVANSKTKSETNVIVRALSIRPLVFLGKISFSLYLWHWPLLVFYNQIFSAPLTKSYQIFFLSTICFSLSFITYKYIEVPGRNIDWELPKLIEFKKTPNLKRFFEEHLASDFKLIAGFVIFCSAVVVTIVFFRTPYQSTYNYLDPTITTFDSSNNLQEQIQETITVPANSQTSINWSYEVSRGLMNKYYTPEMSPALDKIKTDPWGLSLIEGISCTDSNETAASQTSKQCKAGNLSSNKHVLILGDSHAYMLAPTIFNFYRQQNINFQLIGRSGCPIGGILTNSVSNLKNANFCGDLWETTIPQFLNSNDFDLIVLTDDGETNRLNANLAVTRLKKLNFKNAKVLFVKPSPRYPNPIECMGSKNELSNCLGSPNITGEGLMQAFYDSLDNPNKSIFGLSDLLCERRTCPSVIQNTLVTKDGSHFTGIFAEKLKDSLNLPKL